MRRAALCLFAATLLAAAPALAAPAAPVPCGGPLPTFLRAVQAGAVAPGPTAAPGRGFFRGARIDPKVLAADGGFESTGVGLPSLRV